MRGKYYSLSIGESLSKVKILKTKNDTLSVLQSNWGIIHDKWEPSKYCEKTQTLTIKGEGIAIYMDHIKSLLIERCNAFLGTKIIMRINFQIKRK
jgi:hypothetical protein